MSTVPADVALGQGQEALVPAEKGGRLPTTVRGDTARRLEGHAPVGGVLIGHRTYELLPDGTAVEPVLGVRVKGKEAPVDAFLLQFLP